MEFTDKALILKIGKFKEADLWVRFLLGIALDFGRFCFCTNRDSRAQCLFQAGGWAWRWSAVSAARSD